MSTPAGPPVCFGDDQSWPLSALCCRCDQGPAAGPAPGPGGKSVRLLVPGVQRQEPREQHVLWQRGGGGGVRCLRQGQENKSLRTGETSPATGHWVTNSTVTTFQIGFLGIFFLFMIVFWAIALDNYFNEIKFYDKEGNKITFSDMSETEM